jgi:hypothetical protein
MLIGCAGSQPPIGTPASGTTDSSPAHQRTFLYTGKKQSFKVPVGVKWITVVARGAAGNGYSLRDSYGYHEFFGRGGRVFAIVPVKAGEELYVFVGGKGTSLGGFNGGGNPGGESSGSDGFGGGGASDVREGGDALGNRILVAGGGAAQGYSWKRDSSCSGGRGGGVIGGTGGCGSGGSGGTQKSGGAGGVGASGSEPGEPGDAGSLGRGGDGGRGGAGSGYNQGGGGGGGGGGYYGGGGGGGGDGYYQYGEPGGGGGGGSSYIVPKARNFRSWQGWKNATGNGLVVFSWK